jgi:hypothetical protein
MDALSPSDPDYNVLINKPHTLSTSKQACQIESKDSLEGTGSGIHVWGHIILLLFRRFV